MHYSNIFTLVCHCPTTGLAEMQGMTALMLACGLGHVDCVAELMAGGAAANARNARVCHQSAIMFQQCRATDSQFTAVRSLCCFMLWHDHMQDTVCSSLYTACIGLSQRPIPCHLLALCNVSKDRCCLGCFVPPWLDCSAPTFR